MANLKNTVITLLNHCSQLVLWCLSYTVIFKVLRWNSPHYDPKVGPFGRYWETPRNHRFQLVLYGAYHQSDILEISWENSHLTSIGSKRWPICQMLLQAFESSFSGRLMDDILDLLRWNPHLTPLRPKIRLIWKISSGVSKSSLSASSTYGTYHQSDNLQPLLWNIRLTPLRPKIWPNCNKLSHASEWTFLVGFIVLMVRAIFWSPYD